MTLRTQFSLRPFFACLALPIAAVAVLTSGCGSSTTTSSADGKPAAPPTTAAAELKVSDATNVVAQFLDAVRRGGEDNGANQLLTSNAQAVLQRLGRTVQPIGSPDAVFSVTRAEAIPDTPNAALVHSVWTEPVGDGQKESYQVVWALESEPAGWRISGLAMDLQPGQEPMIVDFENSGQMASLLNSDEPPAVATGTTGNGVSQAAATSPTTQR